MYIRDDDATQRERPTDDLPRTVPGFAPERLGRSLEPRSEVYEDRLFQRICAAMRDADGTWARRFGLALTWSVHDGPDSSPWSDDHDEQETYALRMVTVHAVEVSDQDEPWRAPTVELRQESLWLMRHHLEAIEVQRPRLYGGSAYVLLSAPPTGAATTRRCRPSRSPSYMRRRRADLRATRMASGPPPTSSARGIWRSRSCSRWAPARRSSRAEAGTHEATSRGLPPTLEDPAAWGATLHPRFPCLASA